MNEPRIPGSQVPLEELNTAPAPTPGENESEKFRGTLLKKPEKKEKKQAQESKASEEPKGD